MSGGTPSESVPLGIHRIGGSAVENLRLKPAELQLSPPGISVIRAASPAEAAAQMREAYPDATRLHEEAKTVASSSVELIRRAGFDVVTARSRRLPGHCRIIHPQGAEGCTDENLARLAAVFTTTTGH